MAFCSPHVFSAGELILELRGLMDQDRQMLRADKKLRIAEKKGDQRYFAGGAFAVQANGGLGMNQFLLLGCQLSLF
jgi:hypothetical protein